MNIVCKHGKAEKKIYKNSAKVLVIFRRITYNIFIPALYTYLSKEVSGYGYHYICCHRCRLA